MSALIEKYMGHVTKFSFPYIDTEHEYRALTVERRGRPGEDSWAICDGFGQVYQPNGRRWAYERSPSSRTDRFLSASRMPLEQALPIAERLAEKDAKIWADRLARMIARQEAAQKAKEGTE